MLIDFYSYIKDAKKQLCCNMSEEDKKEYICYLYTDDMIDKHIDYFKKCYIDGLSSYKALLFFYDYLNDLKTKPNEYK